MVKVKRVKIKRKREERELSFLFVGLGCVFLASFPFWIIQEQPNFFFEGAWFASFVFLALVLFTAFLVDTKEVEVVEDAELI